jgi:hypothetical protein
MERKAKFPEMVPQEKFKLGQRKRQPINKVYRKGDN